MQLATAHPPLPSWSWLSFSPVSPTLLCSFVFRANKACLLWINWRSSVCLSSDRMSSSASQVANFVPLFASLSIDCERSCLCVCARAIGFFCSLLFALVSIFIGGQQLFFSLQLYLLSVCLFLYLCVKF